MSNGPNSYSTSATGSPRVAACPDCDLLYREVAVRPGQLQRCSRCRRVLRVPVADSLDKTFALSLTGLLLYIPAMTLPVMTVTLLGLEGKSSIIDSVYAMFETGYPFIGTLVFLTAVLFPLLKLFLLFWVTLSVKVGCIPRYLALVFRTYKHLAEWGMLEVYMLGILVSIIKIHGMGNLEFNLGFFCFFALCMVTVAASVVAYEQAFWYLLDRRAPENRHAASLRKESESTARQAELMRCHDCGLLVPTVPLQKDQTARCPRCRAPVHSRRPNSISATWALLICAVILLLPANLLPIMRVDFLGNPEITTIMDGVIYFFKTGEYAVGGIIFAASVLVPLFKIVGIMLILLSIQYRWHGWLKHKAKMFRFVQFIGRWSFLDIFVIALLAAMIQFGALSSIAASAAARYFTGVVIVTMIAAVVFDPRLLWDSCANTSHDKEKKNDGSNH